MHINWYGQSCFKIAAQGDKKSKQWTNILIDPYDESIGLKMPKMEADILLSTHDHYDHNDRKCLKTTPFIIDGPGEYEVKDIFIKGVSSFHDESKGSERGINTIYTILAEDINLCHMGDFGEKELSSEQIEKIGSVDVLFIPVGGVYTIDAKGAARVISQIEPRMVIPMHYKIPGVKVDIHELSDFLKAIGEKGAKTEEKLVLQRKDFSGDDMKVVPLVSQAKKAA